MASALTRIRDTVVAGLRDRIGACVLLEVPESDAFSRDELPAVVVRAQAFTFQRELGADSQRWEGAFAFDIFVASGGWMTLTEQHADIAGAIAGRLDAMMDDADGLGGLCNEFEPAELSAAEDAGTDQGGVTLLCSVRFYTRASDWNAIIGPAGTIN